jgi:MFS transporter, MHS family, citrate/tricarballylate:H+ symporter
MVANIGMTGEPSERAMLRTVMAVGFGNALEFYDFVSFSFFAIQIGHTFFPAEQTSRGLLYSLAAFGVGFVARPLGGIVIGTFGDRAGRKPAMVLSLTLMGIAIIGLALTPSYATLGIAAPSLLVGFRLLQGFALGGEVGPSTALLIEAAPPHRRGFYAALQGATQALADLIAGGVGFALSSGLSPAALDAWGWRVAFLIGGAAVPVGLYVRRRLPETLHVSGRSTTPAHRHVPARLIVLGVAMLMAATINVYVVEYMTTYAQDSLKIAANLAFGATVVNGLFGLCASPLSGLLSDRIGRKPVMLGAAVLLLVLVIPSYIAMIRLHSATVVYAATAVLGMLSASFGTLAIVTITESLPKAARSGSLSILYAVTISIFGGSTQFMIKWLIDATRSALAPAWYMTAALVIGGLAMVAWRESAPAKTRQNND